MKALLFLLLGCSIACARVGEKYADFKKRIGVEPIAEKAHGKLILSMFGGDVKVLVEVVDGTISTESYFPIDMRQAEALIQKQKNGLLLRKKEGAWSDAADTVFAVFKEGTLMITDHRSTPLKEAMKKAEAEEKKKQALKTLEKF